MLNNVHIAVSQLATVSHYRALTSRDGKERTHVGWMTVYEELKLGAKMEAVEADDGTVVSEVWAEFDSVGQPVKILCGDFRFPVVIVEYAHFTPALIP